MPESPASTFKIQRTGSRALIVLEGELDIVGAPELTAAIDGLLAEPGVEVVVDLRGLTFMDSSGLQALLHGHRQAQQAPGSFSLVRGSDAVMRVFELAGVNGLIPFARPAEVQ